MKYLNYRSKDQLDHPVKRSVDLWLRKYIIISPDIWRS